MVRGFDLDQASGSGVEVQILGNNITTASAAGIHLRGSVAYLGLQMVGNNVAVAGNALKVGSGGANGLSGIISANSFTSQQNSVAVQLGGNGVVFTNNHVQNDGSSSAALTVNNSTSNVFLGPNFYRSSPESVRTPLDMRVLMR